MAGLAGMDWKTIGAIAVILFGLFGWLKRDISILGKWLKGDIKALGDRLGVVEGRLGSVENALSYLRVRLDGPPDSIQNRPSAG